MAFKNLEQRFNENVDKLYAGATSKFAGGKPSSGRNDDPLVVRKPGDGYFTLADRALGRSIPLSSTIQDVKRLTLFSLSTRGLTFLAKQQLLQTGNTFEFTRVINPAFVVANAVPFLHIKRNLRPLGDLIPFKKTDTSYENVRKLGQLQVGTYDSVVAKWKIPSFIGDDKKKRGLFAKIGNSIKNAATNALKSVVSLVNPKKNVGDKFGYDAAGWKKSRPELAEKSIVAVIDGKNTEFQRIHETDGQDKRFLKYFSGGKVNSNSYPAGITGLAMGEDLGDAISVNRKFGIDNERADIKKTGNYKRKISYITDVSNLPPKQTETKNQEAYKLINSTFEDPILVSFAMGKDDPVRFRAFIKDLNQSATPEYKQYQYIGRMEKFINYVGVQREISFKLGIIAFGPDELDGVWRRINYITGLVYPYGFHRGLFQPNIVRLTIGDLYVNHPGYVTSLSTNFNELGESWEIDKGKQVPIGAQMDIKFTLIEKASRIADSPFYGITDGGNNGKPMNGFSSTITPPAESAPGKKTVDSRTNNFTNTEENFARGTGGGG